MKQLKIKEEDRESMRKNINFLNQSTPLTEKDYEDVANFFE